jgi:hypothetical protein
MSLTALLIVSETGIKLNTCQAQNGQSISNVHTVEHYTVMKKNQTTIIGKKCEQISQIVQWKSTHHVIPFVQICKQIRLMSDNRDAPAGKECRGLQCALD